jgi:hypothetical protein
MDYYPAKALSNNLLFIILGGISSVSLYALFKETKKNKKLKKQLRSSEEKFKLAETQH